MTPAATAHAAAPSFCAPSSVHRLARTAVALAAVSALGGCALWRAMFGEAPAQEAAPAVVASAPQAPASVPVASEPLAVTTPVSNPAPPTAAELTPPSPLPVAAAPTAPAGTASAPRLAVAQVPSAAGFYLNIGLFAVPTNGSNAVHKLEAAGQSVFFEVIDSKKGPLTRVRVGPFAKRADADAAAKKIHALKLDAVVFERK